VPTYEYVCRACGHEFERFQSITADPVRTCPKCGKRKVERKIGIGAGVLFRGGGFYETDYRSESYSKAERAERESGSKSDGASGDAKAKDTKPSREAKAAGSAKAAGDAKAEKPDAVPAKDSAGGSGASKSDAGAKADGGSKPRKSHAREGRGIGNILALGRGAGSGGVRKGSAGAKPAASRSATPRARGKRR
jgi:putative FmdB family regulatory protein